jgi:hypothetical protein
MLKAPSTTTGDMHGAVLGLALSEQEVKECMDNARESIGPMGVVRVYL